MINNGLKYRLEANAAMIYALLMMRLGVGQPKEASR